MSKKETGTRFTASLIAGLLAIPISAYGAFAIVSNNTTGATQMAASSDTSTSTAPPTTEAPTTTGAEISDTVVFETPTASDEILAQACGPDGMALVEGEAAELLDEVQQAALDALRQVCEEAGMPLPGPPAPPPQVITVTVADSVTSAIGGATTSSSHHDDDDEYEDHEEEEHEDHEEEHEEHDD